MSDENSNWWGKNAVLAAAVAGLLGLVGTVTVAIITTSRSRGSQGSSLTSLTRASSAGAPDSSVRGSKSVSSSTNPPQDGSTTPAGPGTAIVWSRDRIRLPYGTGLDLDAAAPTLTDNGEFDVSIGDSPDFPVILLSEPAGSLGSDPVSYAACADAIASNTISDGYLTHPGDTFCEKSASGSHLAAVTIKSWDPRGASGYGVSEVAVVVWQTGA